MSKMHHFYPTSTGDALCPLGFHPQVRWPTRCKRCFRDYKDHAGKNSKPKDLTSSSPSLTPWETPVEKAPEKKDGRSWSSTSNLFKGETNEASLNAAGWNSVMDLTAEGMDQISTNSKNARPKTYAGSQSDTYNLRRHSYNEDLQERPQKLQIRNVISKTNGTSSNTDAEFIIQVRKSRVLEPDDVQSFTFKQGTLEREIKKGEKTEKNEMEKLRAQLNDLRIRCERAEREKSELMLRRLASMDSSSTKATLNEVMKLQKAIKELQTENKGLTDEKSNLLIELKNVQKELNSTNHRSDREKVNEELRSKLSAAENLCESLMDENEEMKREIRELEEEIYEMQDNFREEQVDEYTSLRKNLEQSNKNCRILSFKLRKVERRSEQLENEKKDTERRYEQVKKIEEILKKIGIECKSRSLKKTTDSYNKIQLNNMIEGMGKEIGDAINIFIQIVADNEDAINQLKTQNSKNEDLLKEHEALKEKLESTLKDLAAEKESKSKTRSSGYGLKTDDAQNVKKKLEEVTTARDADKKSWNAEKVKLQEEEKMLNAKVKSLSEEKQKIQNDFDQLKKDFDNSMNLKNETSRMETAVNRLKKELEKEKEKSKKLQDDLVVHTDKESRITKTLATVEKSKSQLEADLKLARQELESNKTSHSAKVEELRTKVEELQKEKDKLESEIEQNKLTNETEVAALKKKNALLQKSSVNAKKITELKQNYDDRIRSMEADLQKSVDQHYDLKMKYEELQKLKEKSDDEKEILNSELFNEKQAFEYMKSELEKTHKNWKTKENEWQLQKTRLEELLQKNRNSLSNELHEENNRLKKEMESMTEQLEDLKKNNDNLNEKLKDFDTVSKIQRNFSADSSALESELRKLKNTLANAEKAKKADLAQCKLQYEHRIVAINDEIQSIKTQLSRYKRERDMYKTMLDAAQKSIAELKTARQRKHSGASTGKSDDDDDASSGHITELEKQLWVMEDELSDTKLEASKLKTELASEKSAYQIKFSEMQSRINELEEERLLARGRTKIPGLKVRMELAWQKEREEQQKLLQETATLARDLQQTLLEVDRERDKERLENKRKQDQLKKLFDEEKEENKKKLMELQCDLLELRDAHAKLRTSNEKIRREKERQEREREELRNIINNKRRVELAEVRNINVLLKQVDDLVKLFPEVGKSEGDKSDQKNPDTYTPTPPRRMKGPKSRESSPKLDSRNDSEGSNSNLNGNKKPERLEHVLARLITAAKELQGTNKAVDEAHLNRMKKFSKRSSSVENESEKRPLVTHRSRPSLKRKSLSLEQTLGKNDQVIWTTDSNVSSIQSLDGNEIDTRHYSLQRDSSVDSRLSGGSTKSEIIHRDKKYGEGIIRKLAGKLTKSVSINDSKSSFELQTSGSETSIHESRLEKKNLKKKISNMFRKSSSKSNGLDKKPESRESSRPASRTSMSPRS